VLPFFRQIIERKNCGDTIRMP